MSTLILFGVIGLLLGSFGNMLLYRIRMRKSFGGRSFCPHCKHTIAAYDLIPVLSFVLLGGRCRHCKKTISLQYPLVEMASLFVWVGTFALSDGDIVKAGFIALACWSMVLLSIYDTYHQEIPDLFTIVIGVSALTLMSLGYTPWRDAVAGALIAGGWFGVLWVVSRGRAVGTGDAFLATALGLLLGSIGTTAMLLVSYIIGAVAILFLLAQKKVKKIRHERIAFGPFLVIGAFMSLLGVGEWYLSLLGL